MEVLEAIRKRRSIRKYKGDPLPEDTFHRILEAGRLAPSGKNFQPWKFIVVRDERIKRQLAEASARQYFIAEAPIIIVACGFPEQSYARLGRYMSSWAVDVAIALQQMMLQATAEGVGTCWIGAFEEQEVKKILQVPEEVRVLGLTPLGYPAEDPPARPRKPLEQIISYDRYY
ncbi:MAG: nitroreductase [Candidatus Aminicenantes bacterium 4484_214]|nr:MAG: nitroreductase [Candidatus Aminicenantes bacterium 4484_214]RLE08263.1 MAG: nitroreductase [Candidatus Aminicenantes bacterium]